MSALRLLLSCTIAISLLAQRSDTVFQLALAGVTGPTRSGTLRNIGQSGHILWVQLSGLTCPAQATVDIYLEASFDANVWAPAGARITQVSADTSGARVASAVAQGAFPHIRAAVDAIQSGCSATIYYSGTVGGQGVINLAQGGQFPQYFMPAPTTVSVTWTPGSQCFILLDVSNESGILDKIAVRATSNLSYLSHSIVLSYSVDGSLPVTIVPIYSVIPGGGTPYWSDAMRALGTGVNIVTDSGAVVEIGTHYRTSLLVRVCAGGILPPAHDIFSQLYSVYRRVQVN